MFDHSVKVPRLYKTASKIAKQVSESKGSIKQLVYESKHPNIKGLYALVVHTFQRTNDIENLLKKSKLLIKEPRFDPWLAKILITELLWGKKYLSSQAKPIKTILAYEQIFKAHLSDVSEDIQDFQEAKPRYVRINTLKVTINEAIEGFTEEGWVLKRYTDKFNYLGFLDEVANLGSEEFMIDFHIPYLLIFPPKTPFYQHEAYKKGSIILQDKASCLPVYILNPEPGYTILDMCAAPGMKTSQCAAVMEDKGKIYAVEIGKKRFQTLNKIIESCGATCVETINADVLTLTAKQCPDVEYVLVDPSCSGSGITDRVEIGQQDIEQHKDRLGKLASFQMQMLRHAFIRFPKARKVVYSTCSVYPEENEDVVRQVLETCTNFKLIPAAQFVDNKWENFGSPEFGDIGNYCLYAKPDIDLTSGFFVAVFKRMEEGETNPFLNTKIFSRKFKKTEEKREEQDLENTRKVKVEKNEPFVVDTVGNLPEEDISAFDQIKREDADEGNEEKHKRKKKKKKHKHREQSENAEISGDDDVQEIYPSQALDQTEEYQSETIAKKKKMKDLECTEFSDQRNDDDEDEVHKSKKKKKENHRNNHETNELLDLELEESHPDEQKKKKKKSKNKDVSEQSTYFEEIVDDEDIQKTYPRQALNQTEEYQGGTIFTRDDAVEGNEKNHKKKKKKQKHREQSENAAIVDDEDVQKTYPSQALDQTEENQSETISKKKKKKNQDQRNDVDEDEVYTNKMKKKETHQNNHETNEILGLELEESLLDEQKKKKKKPKNKHVSEQSIHFEEIGDNKKRKNIEDKDIAEVLSSDCDKSQEKKKSKKKKIKT